jgi:hypothetical protein
MSLNFCYRFCRLAGAVFAIILLLVLAEGQKAHAQYMTGADLSQSCAPDSGASAINRCLGYIAGVIDYHIVMQSLGTNPSTDFCLPKGLVIEEAAINVLAYLNRKPDQLGFIAAPAVALALNAVYPCKSVR